MNHVSRHTVLSVPFPQIQGEQQTEAIVQGLRLYPFGYGAESLAIDFEHTLRPWLETGILQCCASDEAGQTPPENFFWSLDVSNRTECLLAIASLAESSGTIAIDMRCQNAECLEEMEIEISPDDVAGIQRKAADNANADVVIDGQPVTLRRPTGNDQRHWLSQSYSDDFSAAATIINSLLPEGQAIPINPDSNSNKQKLQTIEEAMEAMDPLVNFHLDLRCPVCGSTSDYFIDLGEICLRKLQQAQNRLVEMIHTLAFSYHWTEQDIFSLPPWRRHRYLSLIEQEVAR